MHKAVPAEADQVRRLSDRAPAEAMARRIADPLQVPLSSVPVAEQMSVRAMIISLKNPDRECDPQPPRLARRHLRLARLRPQTVLPVPRFVPQPLRIVRRAPLSVRQHLTCAPVLFVQVVRRL